MNIEYVANENLIEGRIKSIQKKRKKNACKLQMK